MSSMYQVCLSFAQWYLIRRKRGKGILFRDLRANISIKNQESKGLDGRKRELF